MSESFRTSAREREARERSMFKGKALARLASVNGDPAALDDAYCLGLRASLYDPSFDPEREML